MKKTLLVIMLLIIMMMYPFSSCAEDGYADDFRYSIETENSLLSDHTDLNDPESLMDDLRYEHWYTYLKEQLKGAFDDALSTLIKGLGLTLLSILVCRFGMNIQSGGLRLLYSFMVSFSIVLMCEENLRASANALQKGIENVGVFTASCIPSFSIVMIAAGEGGGAGVFSASMVLLGEIGSLISKNLLLPLTEVYLSIGICSAISDEYNFALIGKNIRKFLIWVIGLLIIGFRTILKLQNAVASSGDQLTKKYIRSAVGTLIPVVGNSLSSGIDGLFSVASGVRTSFAIAGVLITLSILIPILIPIGVNGLIWSFCKWFAGFLNDKTVASIADVLSNGFYLMLALGGFVGFMALSSFFGLITQVI